VHAFHDLLLPWGTIVELGAMVTSLRTVSNQFPF
jgi:hypothetical protein